MQYSTIEKHGNSVIITSNICWIPPSYLGMQETNFERMERLTIEEAIQVIQFVRESLGLPENDMKNSLLDELIEGILREEITPHDGIVRAREIVNTV